MLGPEGPEVMDSLKEELERRLPDHEDRGSILSGLVRAVVTEEVARQTITKQPMISGQVTDIDKNAVISRWKCLAEHYRGSKHEQHLRDGVEQLEGLNPDVAVQMIHHIRRQLAPAINWSMERTVIQPSVKVPWGRFVLDGFQVRGTRVALWKWRSQVVRLAARAVLWSAAISGSVHWILWVMFEQPYLLQQFPGVAKAVQFILIGCTTLFAWAFTRSRSARPRAGRSRLVGAGVAIGCWGLLAAAWVHWILWVVFRVPDLLVPVEPFAKMGQALFLMAALAAAFVLSKRLQEGDQDREAPGGSTGRAEAEV